MKTKFKITGMSCSACSTHIEKDVSKLHGINSVNVSLLTNSMEVDFDKDKLSEDDIISAVTKSGYGASLFEKENVKTKNPTSDINIELKNMQNRLIISFVFLIPLMYVSMGNMLGLKFLDFLHEPQNAIALAFTQLLLSLPILYVNRKFFIVGFKSLFRRSPNMDSLIAIGSSASVIYGIYSIYKIGYLLGNNKIHQVHDFSMNLYFESAAMILALITLGKYLETRSKGKTSEAITKLINLTPETATVIRDNKEITINSSDISLSDIIVIKPGERIPVDGIVLEGNSYVDESALTGESIPVSKKEGSTVISATINKTGSFKFKPTKLGDDTTIAQIIKLVEEASSSKAPIAKLADKVSGIFVPIVITIAVLATIIWLLLGYDFEFALSIGISVLVISCPCALGLATPVAIMVGTGKGAENGILIKNAEALETLHSIDTLVLDKTGTITEGNPSVTNIICSSGITENELLKIAASIEKPSEHPLGDAIVNEANNRNIVLNTVTNFKAIIGYGIEGAIDNTAYYAGNIKFMKNNNIPLDNFESISNEFAKKGKTPLFFATTDKILGIIVVADVVKRTSKKAIKDFENEGIEVIMLTGDNKLTAEAIKNELDINNVISEVLPNDKEKVIAKLQKEGKNVAMIGDGINDAPALMKANVGIAIGAGTDIAIESADVILMKSDLVDAFTSYKLSKAVIKNIKENLFWAFIYNIIGIPIACGIFYPLFGFKLNPMIAAAFMSLSSVSVVTNALRLKLFKYNSKNKGVVNMKKTIYIDGMMCSHCTGRVSDALNNIPGVKATVSLENKLATVEFNSEIPDEVFKRNVEDAGYTVTKID
ncbi:MAG: heavy metal translocating P-type ATPase [Clostridiales bacterium]|nr:heavy metal translocating P-type ATPase [Clostridiales bacterium]